MECSTQVPVPYMRARSICLHTPPCASANTNPFLFVWMPQWRPASSFTNAGKVAHLPDNLPLRVSLPRPVPQSAHLSRDYVHLRCHAVQALTAVAVPLSGRNPSLPRSPFKTQQYHPRLLYSCVFWRSAQPFKLRRVQCFHAGSMLMGAAP